MLQRQPCFVFHGFKPRQELFKRNDPDWGIMNMESDFVIVRPGSVIAIECKTTLDSRQLKKAGKQWDELKKFLEDELGLGADFVFIKCLAYTKVAGGFIESGKCSNCDPYLLKFESVDGFLDKFHSLLHSTANTTPHERFKSIVRDLLICTSEREDCQDVRDRVANAYARRHNQFLSTPAETVFFWSPEQYDIIKQDRKFVCLNGGKFCANTQMLK